MTIIKARLNDQALSLSASPVVASGGVEEDVVTFEFDSTWAGYVKKAVFYRDESNVYHVDVGSDNTAVIPWEVLQQAGHMYFGVFGTKGSEVKTSTVAKYRVERGAITIASGLMPTPDIFSDVIANTAARHSHDNKTVLDGITADDVAKWRGTIGTFRVNVTYSDGVYSADKTFDEIKAAYDAGQLPYVVSGGDMIYTLSYYYFASEQMFMDFERYLIWEDTLETETLRIYFFATGSGSNIVKKISAFNVPSAVTDDHINSLIDTKLGVIENGSY